MIKCKDKSCGKVIGEDGVFFALDLSQRSMYTCLMFIKDFHHMTAEKLLTWCYRCRVISVMTVGGKEICKKCNQKLDLVKELAKLFKLVLRNP